MSSLPDIDKAFALSLKLSRLSVSGDKRAQLSADLGKILEYVEAIEAVDASEVEPLLSPLELSAPEPAPWREDRRGAEEGASEPPTAPGADSGHLYIVPQIIERDD